MPAVSAKKSAIMTNIPAVMPATRGRVPRFAASGALAGLALAVFIACGPSPGPSSTTTVESVEIRGTVAAKLVDEAAAREEIGRALSDVIRQVRSTRVVGDTEIRSGDRPYVRLNFLEDQTAGSHRVLASVLVFGADPSSPTEINRRDVYFRARAEGKWHWTTINAAAARATLDRIGAASGMQLGGLLDLDAAALDALRRSIEKLSSREGIFGDRIRWRSVEAVDWPNTALGYPKPGMAYAMMIVPGHRVRLVLPDGREIECHTAGDRVELPPAPETGTDSPAEENKGVRG
jgi:hypothetical protein